MRKDPGTIRSFFIILLCWVQSIPALASPVCSNLLIETKAGDTLFKKYRHELKKAIFPQLKALGWRGKKYISVQNLPATGSRIAPKYMIRIDLHNKAQDGSKVILRNKTVQSALKLVSNPLPELNACDLVLEAIGDEYLVNQVDVPTKIYVPFIKVSTRVKFKK